MNGRRDPIHHEPSTKSEAKKSKSDRRKDQTKAVGEQVSTRSNSLELSHCGTRPPIDDETWIWHCRRQIRSIADEAAQVITEVLRHLERHEWNSRDRFAVHLAMEEALMNAIKHGNCRDPEKTVEVQVRTNHQAFHAQITDQGSGFSLCKVPDPRQDCNIETLSGRGVLLMDHYMDWICYNGCGNSVEMYKRRSPSS